jgi:hypothetical protein
LWGVVGDDCCEAFGFSGVTISGVKFEFSAEGSARLEKSVTIHPEGAGCEVIIPAQTMNNVAYNNETGGKLLATASITKIHSKGSVRFVAARLWLGIGYVPGLHPDGDCAR